MPATSVSFILLAYNEANDIEQAIADCRLFARAHLTDYEIIVVDDGSTDDTAAIADASSVNGDVRVLRHTQNRGMGASMRNGYRSATKDFIAHLPGDRQVRANALLPMLAHATSETVARSVFENPPSGTGRAAMSRAFRILTRHIGGFRVNFAGTYLFHRSWLNRANTNLATSDTFLYSFQLLELFRRAGARFTTTHIPTYPREHGSSREATLSRIAHMFMEIARARL